MLINIEAIVVLICLLEMRINMVEIPFIPGNFVLLIISIVIARFYGIVANNIGDQIRKLFIGLWQKVKNKYYQLKL